jgi:hypothetical protein
VTNSYIIPEIATAIAEYVAVEKPYLIRTNPDIDLRVFAMDSCILPVLPDMGGCLCIRWTGEVVSFGWDDEPLTLQDEHDERIRNMVYLQASLKYPVMIPLVPNRPRDAITCLSCDGSGTILLRGAFRNIICFCGGLGWLPASYKGRQPVTGIDEQNEVQEP